MMRRSNPFEEIERMFERMSKQFDDMGRGWEGGPMGSVGSMGAHGVTVDVADHDDEIVVTADLPGFEKEDIDLTVSERTLTVRADREAEDERETGEFIRRERRSSSMSRSIRLPEEVDEDGASASYRNGVLTVTLPKLHAGEDEDSHRIDIE
ncbi:archaeal heat shock protein Hsp14 [Halegenticoccus tardaugens]|uniref:archaeal heat shock protein Hsp14 n=1 Tax=Halegenticoccus tardaugens TaxID=2071624 RepID=UPI00100BC593|nr:archaeal heat shock protein Hsp14 [Halegenticoccus tardaugens]